MPFSSLASLRRPGSSRRRWSAMTMAMVSTPANTIGHEMAAEHDRAAKRERPYLRGARLAGAIVQKAWLASPDTKEQFRLQASLGRHQGWKSAVPANC